jgi:hypothetical protein
VNDETGQEEAHEHRHPQIQLALVLGRGARETQEEQEAADEERRIVGRRDGPGHEGQMNDRQLPRDRPEGWWDGVVVRALDVRDGRSGRQRPEFPAERQQIDGGREYSAASCAPA